MRPNSTPSEPETRNEDFQRAMLNILEDFCEERSRFSQGQTAMINILEDFDADKTLLRQMQSAILNILEDIDLQKDKVTDAYRRIESVNGELAEFAYAASHDLKAPLRVIANASRWLEEDLEQHLTDETREHMGLMRGRIKRMDKLLDDLLEYSRIGRSTDERYVEIIAGDVLTNNILALLSPPQGFSVTIDPGFADINVRRMPFQQILMNLVSNAIKHHDREDGHIEVTAEDNGAHYTIVVKDDGPGIPEQFQAQVFKMFQTLRPRDQVEGSGMGLAMVRKSVELFGGKISLDSVEGKGCSFRFTWPKTQQVRAEGATEPLNNDPLSWFAIESAPNAVVMIGADGRIALVNRETEKLFGYARAELLGQPVELLMPERFRNKHPGYRAGFFTTPSARSMGFGRDLYARRKDGSEFCIEIGLNPIDTPDGVMVLSAIDDITERKRAEESVRKHSALLERRVAELTAEVEANKARRATEPLRANQP